MEYVSLGDAITGFLERFGLRDEADMRLQIEQWENLMGRPVARNTDKVWYKEGALFIQMASPIWKQELALAKLSIKNLFNEKIGREVVKEVKVL